MPKIAVTIIERVLNSVVTTDGGHAVLWLRTVDDEALPLALPRDQLPAIVDHCALALSQSEKILRFNDSPDEGKAAVTLWNSSVDPQSRELTLDLTFGRGGTLSFALSEYLATALLATLQSHYKPA